VCLLADDNSRTVEDIFGSFFIGRFLRKFISKLKLPKIVKQKRKLYMNTSTRLPRIFGVTHYVLIEKRKVSGESFGVKWNIHWSPNDLKKKVHSFAVSLHTSKTVWDSLIKFPNIGAPWTSSTHCKIPKLPLML